MPMMCRGFSTTKGERVNGDELAEALRYANQDETMSGIADYIVEFYNTRRPPPAAFEIWIPITGQDYLQEPRRSSHPALSTENWLVRDLSQCPKLLDRYSSGNDIDFKSRFFSKFS